MASMVYVCSLYGSQSALMSLWRHLHCKYLAYHSQYLNTTDKDISLLMPLNAAVMTLYNDIPARCKSCQCDSVTGQVRCVVVTRLNCLNVRGGEREISLQLSDISGDNTHTCDLLQPSR